MGGVPSTRPKRKWFCKTKKSNVKISPWNSQLILESVYQLKFSGVDGMCLWESVEIWDVSMAGYAMIEFDTTNVQIGLEEALTSPSNI